MSVALWDATSNRAKDLFPGNADGAVSIQLIEPTVQLLMLCVRLRNSLGRRGETVPELLDDSV